MLTSELIDTIYSRLYDIYGEVKCLLNHESEFQLLIATILSAQTTDRIVNIVAPKLFAVFPTSLEMAKAQPSDVESIIKQIGIYRNKSRNIIGAASVINEKFNGVIPHDMDELMSLPGVGRKTANVVLGHICGVGFAVDTHVNRLCNRIGIVSTSDPYKIEIIVRQNLPATKLSNFSMLLITHGRNTCNARKPKCDLCSISDLCKFRTQY